MNDRPYPLWYCTRQRAGPLVKECRAIRARIGPADTRQDINEKRSLQKYEHSSVCRTQVDRLELRLALFGFEGSHYTLTYDDLNLPPNFAGVRKSFRAFRERLKRWNHGEPYDWIGCIEGRHGDHRLHIHMVLRDSDFQPAVVRYLWKGGIEVDDEPVLRKEGGFRRLAEYFNKERPDGFIIPIGRHPWSCSRGLAQKIPPPKRWQDDNGWIVIPDDIIWSRKNQHENDFGVYRYGSYIQTKSAFILEDVARTRASILKSSGK